MIEGVNVKWELVRFSDLLAEVGHERLAQVKMNELLTTPIRLTKTPNEVRSRLLELI